MRARYPGTCHSCSQPYSAGADIEKWLGQWVHRRCKLQSRSALEAGAEIVELRAGPVQQSKQTVRPKADFGKTKARWLY